MAITGPYFVVLKNVSLSLVNNHKKTNPRYNSYESSHDVLIPNGGSNVHIQGGSYVYNHGGAHYNSVKVGSMF